MNKDCFSASRHSHELRESSMNRRRFLKVSAMTALAGLLPQHAFGSIGSAAQPERSLAFYNTHTSERLKTVYWVQGSYLPDSLSEINHILRDFRTNEIKNIDLRLLDLLFALQNELDTHQPFHIISGYRSPQTNAFLHAHTLGVAENSLHVVGKAIDIRAPGRALPVLRNAAVSLKGGGVGYYPKSDFVHVDIGRVRYW
jgi:uncharacterized protein YcbK (DUF882 family)